MIEFVDYTLDRPTNRVVNKFAEYVKEEYNIDFTYEIFNKLENDLNFQEFINYILTKYDLSYAGATYDVPYEMDEFKRLSSKTNRIMDNIEDYLYDLDSTINPNYDSLIENIDDNMISDSYSSTDLDYWMEKLKLLKRDQKVIRNAFEEGMSEFATLGEVYSDYGGVEEMESTYRGNSKVMLVYVTPWRSDTDMILVYDKKSAMELVGK